MILYDKSFSVLKSMYPKETVLKTAYNFIDRAYIHLDENKKYWLVEMRNKNQQQQVTKEEFENELLSEAVHLLVYRKTHSLRELLLARALSSSLIEKDNPLKKIQQEQADKADMDLDDILQDWFDKYEK